MPNTLFVQGKERYGRKRPLFFRFHAPVNDLRRRDAIVFRFRRGEVVAGMDFLENEWGEALFEVVDGIAAHVVEHRGIGRVEFDAFGPIPHEWHHEIRRRARFQDAAHFGNALAVVGDVLQDMQAYNEIHRTGRQPEMHHVRLEFRAGEARHVPRRVIHRHDGPSGMLLEQRAHVPFRREVQDPAQAARKTGIVLGQEEVQRPVTFVGVAMRAFRGGNGESAAVNGEK